MENEVIKDSRFPSEFVEIKSEVLEVQDIKVEEEELDMNLNTEQVGVENKDVFSVIAQNEENWDRPSSSSTKQVKTQDDGFSKAERRPVFNPNGEAENVFSKDSTDDLEIQPGEASQLSWSKVKGSNEPRPKRARREKRFDEMTHEEREILFDSDDNISVSDGEDDFELQRFLTADSSTDTESENEVSDEDTVETTTDRRKKNWTWRKADLLFTECSPSKLTPILGNNSNTPLTIFKELFGDDLFNLILLETNRYVIYKGYSKAKPFTLKEIHEFFGILMWMTIVKIPQRRMYWSPQTRVSQIADVMSINRFDAILNTLRLSNNSLEKKRGEVGYDPFYKVRPLITKLNENFSKCAHPESHQTIDEQIVPFKGHDHKKVYLKNKPKKWGYKIWVRAGVSGYCYQFEVAAESKDLQIHVDSQLGESGKVVLRLSASIPRGTFLFFDNYFASPDLLSELKVKGLHGTCTLQSNCTAKCPLLTDKELKKNGRGAVDYRQDRNSGVVICKWYDNKSVFIGSNIHSVNPLVDVTRYERTYKKYIQVKCPSLIQNYNKCMGGVDKCDMLLSLSRLFHKSRKWYKIIIFHLLDLSINNAWLLYRARITGDETDKLPLIEFRIELAIALMEISPGEQPGVYNPPHGAQARYVPADVRYDMYNHFSRQEASIGQRCKLPHCKRKTRFKCNKCNVYLCVTGTSDCFYKFHHK